MDLCRRLVMAWRGACRSLLRLWPITSVGVLSYAVVQNTACFSLPGKKSSNWIPSIIYTQCPVIFHSILVDCSINSRPLLAVWAADRLGRKSASEFSFYVPAVVNSPKKNLIALDYTLYSIVFYGESGKFNPGPAVQTLATTSFINGILIFYCSNALIVCEAGVVYVMSH